MQLSFNCRNMSSNQDLANWWKKGLEKKTPGRKRSKSESVINEGCSSFLNSDNEKENDPVGSVLSESFGSHSFDEVKANTPYKRQDRKWGNKMYKKEDKNKDHRDKKKLEKDMAIKEENEKLEDLLGDPFDEFDLHTTKRLTIHLYLRLWDDLPNTGDLEEVVAKLSGVSVSSVYRWVLEFKTELAIKESRRGKSSSVKSPMDNDDFKKMFREYVKENARPTGQPNMTCQSLADWVNVTLGVSEDDRYSAKTIYEWLHRLNFNVTVAKKKLYFDGHEVR